MDTASAAGWWSSPVSTSRWSPGSRPASRPPVRSWSSLPIDALATRAEADAAFAAVVAEHGAIRGVVHAAVDPIAYERVPFHAVDDDRWDAVWEQTLRRQRSSCSRLAFAREGRPAARSSWSLGGGDGGRHGVAPTPPPWKACGCWRSPRPASGGRRDSGELSRPGTGTRADGREEWGPRVVAAGARWAGRCRDRPRARSRRGCWATTPTSSPASPCAPTAASGWRHEHRGHGVARSTARRPYGDRHRRRAGRGAGDCARAAPRRVRTW